MSPLLQINPIKLLLFHFSSTLIMAQAVEHLFEEGARPWRMPAAVIANAEPIDKKFCSDGVQALFACDPSTTDTQLEFVCSSDPTLGCELIGDQYYCCADATNNPNVTATETSTTTTTTTLKPTTSTTTTPTSTEKNKCIDTSPQCNQSKQLCNDPVYQKLVNSICPKTCGQCASSSSEVNSKKCVDVGGDCQRAKFLCDNPIYSALMTQTCPLTCGRCERSAKEGGSESKECVDNYRRCPAWKQQAFCTSKAYSDSIKRKYCMKSCEMCPESGEKAV